MELKKNLSADVLLERSPEKTYIDEWTHLIRQEKEKDVSVKEGSVVIFRLAQEWLALSTLFFSGVAEGRVVHRIPHRLSSILLGVINLRGLLRLLINFHSFLQLEMPVSENRSPFPKEYQKVLAIEKENEEWVFPVDEIYGIHQLDLTSMQNVPVNVSKSKVNFLKGVILWENKKIGYLDEELLFGSLRRSLL